ncbi:MAG: hypothetical protein IKI34_03000, partial [Eubacterium sp.]|nr:hypothetical protein [Eubacterium sp.]
ANSSFERFLGNIISYKHLKFVLQLLDLNNIDKRNIINDFYERIKNLKYYNNKYYFWLQYAISSIEIKDYSGAKLHFDAAYATLPENLHPFEINNQFARLLMEKMLLESYMYNESTVSEIKKIDELLTPMDAKNDEKFYSYKMAAAYYPRLFNKFFAKLNNEEKNTMRNIAKSKYAACQKYSLNNSNDDFRNKLSDFLKSFLYLSVYEPKKHVDFVVEKRKGNSLYGYFYNDKSKEKAHAFINESIVNQKIPFTIKASVVEYSTEYGKWQLSLG